MQTRALDHPPLGERRLVVGVIGCGGIAASHLEVLAARCGEVEVHFCDSNRQRAEALAVARAGGARAFGDVGEMLSDRRWDVIHVLTPPSSHFDVARRALLAGSHVLVEKPAALGLADTEAMLRAASESGQRLCVGHSMLLMPCVTAGLARLRSGELGRPVQFHSFFGHAESKNTIPYADPGHWSYTTPGGVLQNLISHPASLLVEILGAPRRIHAQRSARNVMPNDLADSVQVAVEATGGYGSFAISMGHGNHMRTVTVWCERGTLSLDLTRQLVVVSRHRGPLGFVAKTVGSVGLGLQQIWQTVRVTTAVATGRLQRLPGVKQLVADFYAALRSGGPLPVSADNVRGVARIQQRALLDTDQESGA